MLHEMRDESPVAAVQRVLAARFGIADPSAVDTMILIDAVRDASPPPREMTIASLRAILRTLVPHDGLEGWARRCAREIVDMLMRGDREVEGYWCSIEGVLTAMLLRVTRGQDLTAPPSEPKAEAVMTTHTTERHAFVRGRFKAGEHGGQMPDETCDVCGRDPRNTIHDVKLVTNEPERWSKLPLRARQQVTYEREVSVVAISDVAGGMELAAGAWGGRVQPAVTELLVAAERAGWHAVIDAEGGIVCLVPPGGAVDEHNDEIPDALVSVVVEMLNLEVG